jgi:type III restriction enzyme
LAAIRSVADLFEGYGKRETGFQMYGSDTVANMDPYEMLDEEWLFGNLLHVQRNNGLVEDMYLNCDDGFELEVNRENPSINSWRYPFFTVEMETGTGKTYVYLRTIHELRKHYGWGKFIIIVPSVAIYEGVVKTFQITREHFRSLYNNETVVLTEYSGDQISRLRSFAASSGLEIMVMTLDAFNKASNVIYKPTEKLQGEKLPYQYIQETRPILILDESQNYTSETSRQALRTLHPLFALKYSATPTEKGATKEINRELMNRVYHLSPVEAFRQGLVKRIEVNGIQEESNHNVSQLHFQYTEGTSGYGLSVEARLNVLKNGELKQEKLKLKKGDNLYEKTGNENYSGLVIDEINRSEGVVIFTNGQRLEVNEAGEVPLSKEEIFRIQIEETIKAHMVKQKELLPLGIKVLSLFFIDRVANYVNNDGLIRKLFDEAYNRIKKDFPFYRGWEPDQVREGYFAKKKGKNNVDEYVDTALEKKTQAEKELEKAAFNLIMKNKERLLSFDEKVSFIFAHSALKEGWDNPNVFQICTLNTAVNEKRKRQEIGRGLRLCVNQEGMRVSDEAVNVLTVIANESYHDYCAQLQNDYIEDGDAPPPSPSNAKRKDAVRNDALFYAEEFRHFWEKLCRKTEYKLEMDEPALVDASIRKLKAAQFPEPHIVVVKGKFVMTEIAITLLKVTIGFVDLLVEMDSTEGRKSQELKNLKKGSDLAKILKDDRFKGFAIVEVKTDGEFSEVTFSDKGTMRVKETKRFVTEKGQVAQAQNRQQAQTTYPVFNFIQRAADATSLKRLTIMEIFKGLPAEIKEKVFRNPEGFSAVFTESIRETLADHIAERIEYALAEDQYEYAVDEVFPATRRHPQKELVDGSGASLYDQVQIDSDIERRFVEFKLNQDDKVVCYFKFPGKFKISIPKIIGNYNPDWGIIRWDNEGRMKLELVRETKGNTNPNLLQFPNEKRKIDSAAKHFKLLGIDYKQIKGDEAKWW